MAITGQLAEFSLPELFQFLEQGKKTGRLAIEVPLPSDNSSNPRTFYIWFRQGRIVAASSRSDGNGLLVLMHRRGWLKGVSLAEVKQFNNSLMVPLGVYLKIRDVLEPQQLKVLFYTQVMRQICALFEHSSGRFEFESKAEMPLQEMTGQMMLPTEVTLGALRVLKNWTALDEKMPEISSSLESLIEGQPHLRLNRTEWQTWEFTNGTMSIKNIAEQLRLPTEEIRQIAFRLIVVGLAEEVPAMAGALSSRGDGATSGTPDVNPPTQEFLKALVQYLKDNAPQAIE
ncbi:MAG: DUF4388 domain-containing protein [Synechococcales cyanobacterium CRU_2_2]|nr:DUF4388 domain-containing protein [Synechococcales cyanobacterium CRU_2_2]